VNGISISNSHRHADGDGPDSDIFHAVDPVPSVPNRFGDKIDTERSLISIGSEACDIRSNPRK
jgi:hypothetical protein